MKGSGSELGLGTRDRPAARSRALFEEIHRDAFSPEDMQRRLTAYLEAERELGRMSAQDVAPASRLLMGTVLTLALSYHFVSMPDHRALQDPQEMSDQLRPAVATILRGLA